MEAEAGVRGYADPIMGNRAENDGARGGAQAVDDDCLAGGAQALIFVDIGADPAAAVVGNPHYRLARPYPCQQQHSCKQPRHQLHIPAPSRKRETESDCLRDARLTVESFETVILSRRECRSKQIQI